MGYPRWFSKIILFTLAVIFTFIWELILFPVLLPKADAENIFYPTQIAESYQNSQLNPQLLLEEGKKLYDTGEFLKAISVLKQAVQLFQRQDSQSQGNQIKPGITKKIQEAIALSNISLAYKQIGEYQQALSYIKQGRKLLEIKSKLNNSRGKLKVFAQILDIQASLQLKLGKPSLALDNWKEATIMYERVKFQDGKTRSLINQNLALQALGRYHQARKILEEVLSKIQKQPASIIKATALRSLGDAQLNLGEIDTSLKTLEKSDEIAKKIESSPQIAATLLSLGNAKRAKGNKIQSEAIIPSGFNLENIVSSERVNIEKTRPLLYVKKPISPLVKELYQQAIQYYTNTINISKSPIIQTKAQLNQLGILIELQELSKAQELSSQLQLKIDALPDSETSIQARINLAQNLFFLKQVSSNNAPEWKDIAQILAKAIKEAETLEDGQCCESKYLRRIQAYAMGILGSIYLQTQNLQTQNLTNAEKLTKKAVDLAVLLDAKDIAYLWEWQLGYIFKLQKNIPKAIYYYSLAVDNLNNLRSELLVLNRDIQFSFRDDVEPVYRQLVDLLLQPYVSQNVSRNNITKNNITKNNINQNNLKKARDVIEALQLREIENYFKEACLQAKPEIVDTVVDKTDTTAAVIYPIILQNRIEIILKLPNQNQFRNYKTFIKSNQVEKTLEDLQYSLRQPDQMKSVQKISGKIYNWLIQPLEADLQKNKIETLVFILDGSLRNIPMAVLYDNQAQKQERKYLIEKYAIVLTPGLQMLEPKPLQNKGFHSLIAGISEKRFIENKEFSAIKNVQSELKIIQSQISDSKQLLNKSFTDINLAKQIDAAKYTIVHLATHGNFSSNLEETYILTWNKLLKLKDFDNLFQNNTDINTNTNAKTIQLLVLSACETAEGDRRATLGLSGIAIRGGARSTIASLWSVEDESTAKFMGEFYYELKNNQLNKAKALQQAQIYLLENSKSPFIWAPYVLVGNWL
ncbi:MAG: CHAT domain-containing protein [Cyanobacteria bacterium P01_A01_bin.84]